MVTFPEMKALIFSAFIGFCPNHLCLGFYIKNNLSYIKRDETCFNRPEFESWIWVAVEVPHQDNIVCDQFIDIQGLN